MKIKKINFLLNILYICLTCLYIYHSKRELIIARFSNLLLFPTHGFLLFANYVGFFIFQNIEIYRAMRLLNNKSF